MADVLANEANIVLETDGVVGTMLFDRPAKRNALSVAMLGAIPRLLAMAADAPLRVLIVTGGAGRCFSTGADIDEFEGIYGSAESAAAFSATFAAAQSAMAAFPKPSIAMISGACVGGGCGLALGCDLRIADAQARFGVTPARLGLNYGLADTKRLVDAVGFAAAADLLFTARIIDAAEALRIGLVSQIVAADRLAAVVRDWASAAAANAPSSTTAIKSILTRIRAGASTDDAASRADFTAAFATADFAEGRRAFAERRRPNFRASEP